MASSKFLTYLLPPPGSRNRIVLSWGWQISPQLSQQRRARETRPTSLEWAFNFCLEHFSSGQFLILGLELSLEFLMEYGIVRCVIRSGFFCCTWWTSLYSRFLENFIRFSSSTTYRKWDMKDGVFNYHLKLVWKNSNRVSVPPQINPVARKSNENA